MMRWLFLFLSAIPCLAQVGKSSLGNVALGNVTPAVVAVIPTINNAWQNTSAGSSVAVTVAATAGRASVVWVGGADSATPGALWTVSDNIDGTTGWSKIIGRTNNLSTYSMDGYFWVKFNMPSGVTTITITGSGSASFLASVIHEVSNVSAATAGESNGSTYTGSTNPQTGTANNATASSIFFAGVTGDGAGDFTINQTGTTGTWNHYSSASHIFGAGSATMTSVPNIVVSSSASRGHGWTLSPAANGSQCVIILH